ncbi:MAG: rhomboid family intramembrane serine protease [Raineya sp.]
MIETTYVIIGFTALTSLLAWSSPKMMQNWIFSPYQIAKKNQWYRFITSGFIHQDYLHLIFNMVSLYFLGLFAELGFAQKFGEMYQAYFLFFYISAMVVADIPVFFKHKNNMYYRALGASGAVSAVIFAAILLEPNISLMVFPIPFRIPGVVYAVLYVLYSAYMSRNSQDNIGHDAHLYGALYGVVFIAVLVPDTIQKVIQAVQNLL